VVTTVPGENLADQLKRAQDELDKKFSAFVNGLADHTGKKGPGAGAAHSSAEGSGEPTPEQQLRGKKGEEEIRRRLMLPAGWDGFFLEKDRRRDGCGYDFLCRHGERIVKLEVKTFLRNGRVTVTSRELQEAGASETDYYLIGVLDDGRRVRQWPTFRLENPLATIMTRGKIDLQAKVHASALEASVGYTSGRRMQFLQEILELGTGR
jgi:hypothetical protein